MNRRGLLWSLAAASSFGTLNPRSRGNPRDGLGLGDGNQSVPSDAHPYTPVPGWPKLPTDLRLGAVSGVAAVASGQVFLLHRGKHPVLYLDRNGTLVRSWGDDVIKIGHGLCCDPSGSVWVTDIGHHQVFKFTSEGRLLLTLGEKDQPGDALDCFNQPTDVAVLPSGEFFVSDGYGNSRIIKFSPDGKPIRTWGQKGTSLGDFDIPHAVVLNSKGNLYVSDRANSRVQVFDSKGRFLTVWHDLDLPPFDGLFCAADDTIYAASGRGNEVFRLDPSGTVLESYGGPSSTESEVNKEIVPPLGRFNVAHGVSADRDGDVYVAEVRSRRVQKLERVRGSAVFESPRRGATLGP